MKDKNDMTQEERCIYLIRTMQREMPQYRGIVIPEEGAEQKRLLRSLMNVRPPMPASSDFLAGECRTRHTGWGGSGSCEGEQPYLPLAGGYHTA